MEFCQRGGIPRDYNPLVTEIIACYLFLTVSAYGYFIIAMTLI